MRILVTNDDGANSEGLWSLVKALTGVGEVSVVAPDRNRSGISAAMTLLDVVRTNRITSPVDGVKAYALQGTPADCVILAHGALFEKPFDIIFSGINQGANVGSEVFFSGTVGAASHGYLRGIASVAISSDHGRDGQINYAAACIGAAGIARDLLESPVEGPLLLNVNTPNVEPTEVEGVEITVPGNRAFVETGEREVFMGREHYWIRPNPLNDQSMPKVGTDVWALEYNRVSISSISPLHREEVPTERLEQFAKVVRLEMEAAGCPSRS